MRLSSLLAIVTIAFLGFNFAAAAAETSSIEVWKSPTCGCCEKWVSHLEENGFAVKTNDTDTSSLDKIKRAAGISEKLDACHVAERPEAIGLSVPGMPLGSPGMEQRDGKTEPYDVLLVKKDGTTEVFAGH